MNIGETVKVHTDVPRPIPAPLFVPPVRTREPVPVKREPERIGVR